MLTYFVLLALSFETQIGPYPDTLLFIRINLAPSMKAAAAGGVALILGALRYRAKIRYVEQSAITAIPATIERSFDPMFKQVRNFVNDR